MAKLSSINKENLKLKLANHYRKRRAALLAKINSPETPDDEYETALKAFEKMPRNAGICRRTRRCRRCGRPKGVYRRFELCRVCLRNGMNRGDIPGLVKASW